MRKSLPTAKSEDLDGSTLMRMRVENIKKIRLVDITFTESLTTIGGENKSGKTSFLDSYKYCLGGKAEMQMDPIHHGAQTGKVICDFGNGEKVSLSVTRVIERVGDESYTASVDVEVPGHITPTRIQHFLDQLAGEMSFDPMQFDEADDATRFNILQKFVSGFDFAANTKAYKETFDERTSVNKDCAREQAAADSITTGPVPPCETVDESALTLELKQAGEKNTDRATRIANREKASARAAELRALAAELPARIAAAHAKRIADHDALESATRDRILDIRMQIRALEEKLIREESDLRDAAQRLDEGKLTDTETLTAEANIQLAEAARLETKIAEAGPLPQAIDADDITARLEAARGANARHAAWKQQRERKAAYNAAAERFRNESDDLTKILEDFKATRRQAIETAALPVAGLGFGDGYVTLDDVPWEQASTAQRIDASTAIAMALNPRLKVIIIHNGSNLDSKMKARIRDRAVEKGYRVLMEVVDDSGGTHVVIQDGIAVKGGNE